MRGLVVALLAVALACVSRGLWLLSRPVPAASDLAAFSLTAAGVLLSVVALALHRRRAWHAWFFSAWIGCSLSALVLAYRSTLVEEVDALGPWTVAGHALAHALIAPITLFFGFVLGFVERDAWMVVLACVFAALLAGEMLRRRLWPRAGSEPLSAGSSAAP